MTAPTAAETRGSTLLALRAALSEIDTYWLGGGGTPHHGASSTGYLLAVSRALKAARDHLDVCETEVDPLRATEPP